MRKDYDHDDEEYEEEMYDEDDDDDEDDEDEEEFSQEVKQSCFNLLVASFISNILEDDSTQAEGEDKAEIIDQILDVMTIHLDDEGEEMLENAFIHFEQEYYVQVQTQEIIQSLEWNQNKDEK